MRSIYHIILLYLAALVLSGCNTGIERTKTITMTKDDLRSMAPTPEEQLMVRLNIPLLRDWHEGKPFLVTDNRASYIFDSGSGESSSDSLSGKILRFSRTLDRITPGGEQETVIEFTDGESLYYYSTGKRPGDALASISSLDIPLLLDLDVVASADSLLRMKKVWTKTQLCYDGEGNRLTGYKFVPVTIMGVTAGDMVFPFKVKVRTADERDVYFMMNMKNNGMESRTFPALFSLTDPKLQHQNITPEIWKHIQAGAVKTGMTKEECKLSLGNPSDVDTGHDWNQTVDIWYYSDGRWLRFSDGLLVAFRM